MQPALRNRIVLAPCTRNRALDDLSPTPGAAEHYASRADAGLLITEATVIAPQAQGYYMTPGIFLDSHERAWAGVTDAVHRAGGLVFLQLWHTGRMAHSHWTGEQPQAPSAVLDPNVRRQAAGVVLHHEMPREMTERDIVHAIAQYRDASARARSMPTSQMLTASKSPMFFASVMVVVVPVMVLGRNGGGCNHWPPP